MPDLTQKQNQKPALAQRASSSGASSGDADHDAQNETEAAADGPSKSSTAGATSSSSDKTISCVSCRKRKLKCDRVKPKCGTCTRLRHDCEFPERKRNLGSKRRNMKELEARLAQVETQLVSESKQSGSIPATSNDTDWTNLEMGMDMNMDMNIDMDIDMDISLGMGDQGMMDPAFNLPQADFDISLNPLVPDGGFMSQELLALGLQEPLPPQDMMDELYAIYFNTYHRTMPIMHKLRFYASLDRAPHMRPPVCLRYAMWTMAAAKSEKFRWFEDVLYERCRRYLQMDEMKGMGEGFVSIYHVQAWTIAGTYEALKTYFSRAWMSTGRAVRLAHMLSLHRLDSDQAQAKLILSPPRDSIELEERRRAFWGAYYGDRWASSGTGWPMIVDEREILTNLPASEESFEKGVKQPAVSLAEALTPEGAGRVTPFGGVILAATLFGHNFQHLHRSGPGECPDDLTNGSFWKRHRKMDNVLSNTFMFLPDHLRLPNGIRDPNVTYLHMNIHASSICLHQTAILTAEKHKLDPNFIRQCQARSLMAAEEIANIMRMITHMDTSHLNSWTGFCLYVAGGAFIQDFKLNRARSQALHNLEFILTALAALSQSHSITDHFTAQLEFDLAAIKHGGEVLYPFLTKKPPHLDRGANLCDDGVPETLKTLFPHSKIVEEQFAASLEKTSDTSQGFGIDLVTTGVLPNQSQSSRPQIQRENSDGSPGAEYWQMTGQDPFLGQSPLDSFVGTAARADSLPTTDTFTRSTFTFPQDSAQAARNDFTPPSDSSTPGSKSMQFPFRNAESVRSRDDSIYTVATTDSTSYVDGGNLEIKNPAPLESCLKPSKDGHGLTTFLQDQMWGQSG